MDKLPLRILLNAEPFGFGPTAAIAGFFPHLEGRFDKIAYMGKKHTLDLQRQLPYDEIHDVSTMTKEERAETLAPIFEQYDIFVTAMDYKMAEYAQKSDIKVVYYDALSWYWPSFPACVKNTDLYLAQNFFGVKERLEDEFADHPQAHLVAPIVPKTDNTIEKDTVLINLGGLQNPFWPLEDIVAYADQMTNAIAHAIPTSQKTIIAASQAVADRLQHKGVKTYSRDEMKDILSHTSCAFMTPGLGNIYDAAAYDIPTAWLPPANDSQGQQLVTLQNKNMIDAALNWHDILNSEPVDFKGDQPDVLNRIAESAKRLITDKTAQNHLADLAEASYQLINKQQTSATAQLIDTFGTGGEVAVCNHILQYAATVATEKRAYV